MKQLQIEEYQKKITDKGYVIIFINHKWMREHIYLVEQFIGRELNKGEVVHHINENIKDNRISNLMLFKSQKEHKSFENKRKRYGYFTNPMKRAINSRWNEYLEVQDEI